MTPRNKHNRYAIQGIFMIAAVIGICFQSWLFFWLAAISLTVISVATGEIRLGSTRHTTTRSNQRRGHHRNRR